MDTNKNYPWCSKDDLDCLLRSFVFETIWQLELKDNKIATMQQYVDFIKTGEIPKRPGIKAVP